MKNNILFGILGMSLILISCRQAVKKTNVSDVVKKQTVQKQIEYPLELKQCLALFPNTPLSYSLDSASLSYMIKESSKKGKKLNSTDVKFLTQKMNRDELTQPNYYYLNDFYKIDQYKKKGKYNLYLDSLDIGMTQDANCYAMAKLEYGDSLALLIWRLDYSSFAACPFYSGTHIMGTIIYGGKVKRTMQLAGYESAMDPPMDSETYQLVNISKSGIIDRSLYINVLEEDQIVENVKHFYINRLTTQGFIKM